MRIYITIVTLQNESDHLLRIAQARLGAFNKRFKTHFTLNWGAGRSAVNRWCDKLNDDFRFETAEFELLTCEIVGQLVRILIECEDFFLWDMRKPFAKEVEQVAELVQQFVALEVGFEVMKMCYGKVCPQKPEQQKFLSVAKHLYDNRLDAPDFWYLLGLPLPMDDSSLSSDGPN